ncbi:MAG: Sua5 family C-terminal domain-containing protein [Bacteroidota bacterium]
MTNCTHRLYETLREADRRGLSTVYCQCVSEDGLGRALMDRLQRAATR